MVPSDRISQNLGSKKSKSKYFGQKILLEEKQNSNTMPANSMPSDDLCLQQKIKQSINGRAIFVIVVVEL